MKEQSSTAEKSKSRTIVWTIQRAIFFIVWLLGCLAFLVILAWLIGRIFTDRFAWSQWLWWIPTPIALAVALVGMLTSLRRSFRPRVRRKRLMRWVLSAVIIALYFATIEHRFVRPAPQATPSSLKLVHWNMAIRPYPPIEQRVERLIALDGDITVLTSPGYSPWEPAVIEKLGAGNPPLAIGTLTVITRLPILAARPLVAVDGIYVMLVQIDATETLGRPIVLYAIDFPSSPRVPRYDLARRVRSLLDQAEKGGQPPDLVVGDFNITRGSASLELMFPGMRHAYSDAGYGYGASFYRQRPLWHIDHVLLGPTMRGSRYDLIDPVMSRHKAQKAWIAMLGPDYSIHR